jgi:uncharacterized protein (DUF934 family)
MAKIILGRVIVEDAWTFVPATPAGQEAEPLPEAKQLLVPLALWQARREELIARAEREGAPLGVWIEGHEDPAVLADDIGRFALIAIHFPRFADGRGYSAAYLLRTRYGFTQELRAIGDVLRDQLFYLKRVGFNAFAVRADKDIQDALNALNDFSETYQASVDQPIPLFRRRSALLAGHL